MKRILRVVSVLLIISVMLSSIAFAYAAEESEYDFESGMLWVVIYAEYTGSKSYESLMPEINIDYVTDVTKTDDCHGMTVVLKENTHQAVLDAIEKLEQNPKVKYASTTKKTSESDVFPGVPGDPHVVIRVELQFVSGGVYVGLKPKYNDVEDYKSLFAELDIEYIELAEELSEGNTLKIVLKDKTETAVLAAINQLKRENEYIRFACKCATKGGHIVSIYKGDANRDGVISNADVVAVARHVVGMTELTDTYALNADMNDDGSITNTDLIAVAKEIVGR